MTRDWIALDPAAGAWHHAEAAMPSHDPEDCPTFTRPPPAPRDEGTPAADVLLARPLPGEDDDGPITDVDDGPPTFGVAPGPRGPSSSAPAGDPTEITLVNAAPPHQRLAGRVVTTDATHVFVLVEGEPVPRRISRIACFEHPIGGGWSTWRLSGADRERWIVEGTISVADANPEDASS